MKFPRKSARWALVIALLVPLLVMLAVSIAAHDTSFVALILG